MIEHVIMLQIPAWQGINFNGSITFRNVRDGSFHVSFKESFRADREGKVNETTHQKHINALMH